MKTKLSNLHPPTRHCCVKCCSNTPQKGRKTCGRHGKRSSTATHRPRVIHLDCHVPALVTQFEPIAILADVMIEVRDNGVIVGLPTNRDNMIAFLADWLARPGNTLAAVEHLTPYRLQPSPLMANAYCHAAEALVRYDLQGGVK
jgi:hypothetical protein